MLSKQLAAIGIIFLACTQTVSAATVLTSSQWTVRPATLIVDVDSNTGYLVDTKGDFLPFSVATGQRRIIRYLGYRYFAGTPLGERVITDMVVKGNPVMFGNSGRFFRFLEKDGTFTHYGAHSLPYEERWLADKDRYKTYGCVAMSEKILDILEETLRAHGPIQVITTFGPQKFLDEVALRERQK